MIGIYLPLKGLKPCEYQTNYLRTLSSPFHSVLYLCKHLRQSIMLTGFGADQTEACIKGIQSLFHLFEQVLPADLIKVWSPSLFDGHKVIDAGNRFFTDRHNLCNHEMVPFKSSVDPDRILEEAIGTKFIHLCENEVEYLNVWMMDKVEKSEYLTLLLPTTTNSNQIHNHQPQ